MKNEDEDEDDDDAATDDAADDNDVVSWMKMDIVAVALRRSAVADAKR